MPQKFSAKIHILHVATDVLTPAWIQQTPDSCVSGRALIALNCLRKIFKYKTVMAVQVPITAICVFFTYCPKSRGFVLPPP